MDAAPAVTGFSPAGRRVFPKANVTATFSEPIKAATLGGAFSLKKRGSATKIPARVTLDPIRKKATLNPSKSLAAGATYTATVSTRATDHWDTPLTTNKVWSFKVR